MDLIVRARTHVFTSLVVFVFLVVGCTPTSNESMTRRSNKNLNLDSLYSDKEMGHTVKGEVHTFRVFSPRANSLHLVLFDRPEETDGREIPMAQDTDGVWEISLNESLWGKYYGYRVFGPKGKSEMFDSTVIVADPYSKAVVTKNTHHQESKTLIMKHEYDWEGDSWVIDADHNKLVIYEAHLRDMTAHESSGATSKGTYLGFVESGKAGGLEYVKSLGINAVEFLPIQKFGTMEIPYLDSSVVPAGFPVNTWNPYARNHWGYMTSYFFAPESYYATDGTMQYGAYNGKDGRAVREMKDMIKALHKEKIAVILDVVFNHVAQYDHNCFKYLDKAYYFRLDSTSNFISASGCGNDFKTERRMARKMILDCIRYWMTEYHVDGFRFDLAAMIDWETCRDIARVAKEINPNVILIAEPWGGGYYSPDRFSEIGWASWNDRIRNAVKGQNPHSGLGFVFGKYQGDNSPESLQNYSRGTLKQSPGGLFQKKEHAVNYLESHDDETMGDFIRVALGEAKEGVKIKNLDKHHILSPSALKHHKLAALFLFTAQGPVMIHEGQEFGRSKVIAPTSVPDKHVGMIDRNSYEKDNETNYLDYRIAQNNAELVAFYASLIKMRKQFPNTFGGASEQEVAFLKSDNSFLHAFTLSTREGEWLIALNGNPKKTSELPLPDGTWEVVCSESEGFSLTSKKFVKNALAVSTTSGVILKKK